MKLTLAALFSLHSMALVSAGPLLGRQNAKATPEQIAALAPDLGSHPNNNPNPFGDCDGPKQPDGKIPKVPCACPPLRADFLRTLTRDVQAGFAVNNPTVKIDFPTGNSPQDKQGRITASIITLQNLNGPGKGCPGVSTTLKAQSDALKGGANAPSKPANPAPAPVTTKPVPTGTKQPPAATPPPAANEKVSAAQIAALAPDLGSQPNTNPNPFGDCDGPRQPDGKIPKVPCACPPTRQDFLKHLTADVNAGFAVNNPTVKIKFPTDDSVQSKLDRITASIITLQNLNGPGKGCPGVSTTLGAQAARLKKQG